jgi:spermidine synthase
MQPDTIQRGGIFLAVTAVALGGIIYELLLGAISSYLLGDSVLQFSLTIGLFLFGMGIGSFAAPYLRDPPEEKFILVESALALLGGNSVLALYAAYVFTPFVYPVFVVLVVAIGTLVGAEIPLLLRMFRHNQQTVVLVSRILSLDYLGALLASLLFPLLLLPLLGVMPTAYLVGLSNMAVALMLYLLFRGHVPLRHALLAPTLIFGTAVMTAGLFGAQTLANALENRLYEDAVVYSRQSAYQKIIVTRSGDDTRLYLNGHLQFSSVDEHHYHEALVHVPLGISREPETALVLGGGDGLSVRELLKHRGLKSITVVDIDRDMTDAASRVPALTALNLHSLKDPKVHVINQDAMQYLSNGSRLFDVILIDLPDPTSEALAKLYSREFYRLVERRMARDGVMAMQATSPYFFHQSFWTIHATIKSAGLAPIPYHAKVPSFGNWGFVVAAKHPLNVSRLAVNVPTRFLNAEVVQRLFAFDHGLQPENRDYPVSTFHNPVVLRTYLSEKRLLERD